MWEIMNKQQMDKIIAQLEEHLNSGGDWEKMETYIDGVEIIKYPSTKSRSAILGVEINPIKDGKKIKRKGLNISNEEQLVLFGEYLMNDDLIELIKIMDQINGTQPPMEAKKLEF